MFAICFAECYARKSIRLNENSFPDDFFDFNQKIVTSSRRKFQLEIIEGRLLEEK
jgi:hypothetical protein